MNRVVKCILLGILVAVTAYTIYRYISKNRMAEPHAIIEQEKEDGTLDIDNITHDDLIPTIDFSIDEDLLENPAVNEIVSSDTQTDKTKATKQQSSTEKAQTQAAQSAQQSEKQKSQKTAAQSTGERIVHVHNLITPKMTAYKHWSGTYKPNFTIAINGTTFEKPEQDIVVKNNELRVNFKYDFMHGKRTGAKEVIFTLDKQINEIDVAFSWKNEWRVVIEQATPVSIKDIK